MKRADYQSLLDEWNSLELQRSELFCLHDAQGDTFFEDEPWYESFQSIEQRMEMLLKEIERLESLESLDAREFQALHLSDGMVQAESFAWDHWEQWALQDGVEAFLAKLGRDVIREARMHNWPDELKAECGWEDSGREMLRLALEEPERAQIRWKYLLDSDGEWHWRK